MSFDKAVKQYERLNVSIENAIDTLKVEPEKLNCR